MKKIFALVLAMLMVAGMVSALAANPVTSEFAHGAYSTTPEDTITATNVTAGDTVEYIQLLAWDPDNGGWVFTTKVSSALTSAGIAVADLVDGITEAEATAVANALASVAKDGELTGSGTTYSKSGLSAGMYYLRAIAAEDNKDTVYNPAFVSCDYYAGGNSVDVLTGIAGTAVLKKSEVPFDKVVNDTQKTDGGNDNTDIDYLDTKPGDVIPFKITTTIPSYGTRFTNPVFTIEDTLSEGLTLKAEPSVSVGGTVLTGADKTAAYTYTPKASGAGYTIAFTADYLKGLNGATPQVIITYEADVTTAALNSVTYMDNKAKLTFSQTPTVQVDKDDITRHYTFSIDGLLNGGGSSSERTHEIIKVAVDQNGNAITSESYSVVTYHNVEYSTLAGATYELKGKVGTHTAGVDKTYTTGTDGHIVFNGLEAGEYTLEETQAPAGFIRDTMVYKVKIEASYDNNDILTGYTITIKDSNDNNYAAGGATFTARNEGTVSECQIIASSESATNPFNNTKGLELPSTGGIGTTIFYIGGSILVLAAAILLITKRRMSAND